MSGDLRFSTSDLFGFLDFRFCGCCGGVVVGVVVVVYEAASLGL